MKLLRFALVFNSVFSLATGATLIFQSRAVSSLFGIDANMIFIILGIGLVAFSATVFAVSLQKPIKPLPVFIIILLDALWVLSSIVLLLLNPFEFTQTGNMLVALVAMIVLVVATLQTMGLSTVDKNPYTGHKELQFGRTVSGDAGIVWDIISDVANYHHVAPNIDDVKIVSGSGEEMVRQCSQGSGSWTENCVLWKEGEQFSFRVNTDAPDYPFPLSFLQGTWKVTPNGRNQSKIEMKFEFQYKRKILNVLLHPMMAPKFRSIVKELLDNWENKLSLQEKG
jgi:ribosome-associated toxin RatA of RatAB toxin-antitoxin module